MADAVGIDVAVAMAGAAPPLPIVDGGRAAAVLVASAVVVQPAAAIRRTSSAEKIAVLRTLCDLSIGSLLTMSFEQRIDFADDTSGMSTTLGRGCEVELLICLLCAEEPFACPTKFRQSHMAMHLRQTHRFEGMVHLPQNRGTTTFWSEGRGRHAMPVLKMLEIDS